MRELRFRIMSGDKWLYFDGIFNEPKISLNQDTLGQFTGIKDKNRVLIYEGDIVKSSGSGLRDCIAEVVWNETYCSFGLGKTWALGPKVGEDFEVIGNIYEDEGLLS